jgi:O-antigen/teichoic acid export membrane protein
MTTEASRDAGGASPGAAQSPLRRSLKNAAWLLGGKGVGGLFSLVYLGLAARSLGVEKFGEFALILSFGQAVAMIAQFQTSEIIIKFGAEHLAQGRHDRFVRILRFSALLDLASALACAALAILAVLTIGPLVGLPDEARFRSAVFGASFLVSLRGAPVGVLRLLDRFDIAALSETVLPATRLAAAVAAYAFAPTVDGYLIAWASAELATTLAVWIASRRELARRNIAARVPPFAFGAVATDNPGLWRFAWFTNFASSISFLWQHAGTLAVGWGAGPTAAGGFRVAMQIAQSLSKPAVSLSRAVFPEFAHMAAAEGGKAVARFAWRLSVVAGLAGLAAVALVAAAGPLILTVVAGREFAFAANLLLLLTIAAAIEFWGFGQEPALLTLGRPGAVLALRAGTGLAYVALLLALLSVYGAIGAAAAAVIGRIVYRAVMTLALARLAKTRA